MSGAVMTGNWFVIYIDDKPSVLAAGANAEATETQFRSMLIGTKIGSLRVVQIWDAPIDDVIRCGIVAQMSILNAIAAALGGGPRAH